MSLVPFHPKQTVRQWANSIWSTSRRPVWAWWLVSLFILGIEIFGHDQIKTIQMSVLALPFLLILLIPLTSQRILQLRRFVVSTALISFVMDSALRHFISEAYEAAPDSSMVLTAVANTSLTESSEFVASYAIPIIHLVVISIISIGLVITLVLSAEVTSENARQFRLQSFWLKALLIIAILLSLVGYASKPWRKLHPMYFWPRISLVAFELRSNWHDLKAQRQEQLKFAQSLKPIIDSNEPSTLVLILSDSLNRDNMSTHGYSRATSPQLELLTKRIPDQLINFRYAWSVEAATIASLESFFYLETPNAKSVHLLALAKAAGYHITWISNHDGQAIEQEHARFADHLEMLNNIPGRDSNSSDSSTHQPLSAALTRPIQRKLIVVHMLGAHPQYKMRYPANTNTFVEAKDKVSRELERQGRSSWLIEKRNEYDAALLNHDAQVVKTLELTKQALEKNQHGAWIFVSDHGQEVAHTRNHAGHSASTPAGFRIPAFIWSNKSISSIQANQILGQRPFRLDWLGWTMLSLMDVKWDGQQENKNILSPDYQFKDPKLSITIANFRN
jgi:heptose-I-phosphate ethanolaminephosphotransferase